MATDPEEMKSTAEGEEPLVKLLHLETWTLRKRDEK